MMMYVVNIKKQLKIQKFQYAIQLLWKQYHRAKILHISSQFHDVKRNLWWFFAYQRILKSEFWIIMFDGILNSIIENWNFDVRMM